jgi:hypothetical protein
MVSTVLYLNGSTDYVEVYTTFTTAASTNIAAGVTFFNGAFLRGGYSLPPSGVGPAFSVTCSAAQSLAALTPTKINFDTEEFDTDNCYDTANKRFQPNVPGYYQINAAVRSSVNNKGVTVPIYKNGSAYRRGATSLLANTTSQSITSGNVSIVVYLNGTTDYIEIYAAFTTAASTNITDEFTYFSGALIRSA